MEEKPSQQQILLFCEDCGTKNFISLDSNEEKGPEIKFRCQACDYLNTVSAPKLPPKAS
nr:hypothetical protein [Desulfobulbaceae bacterium]